jgi:hypothetical protein
MLVSQAKELRQEIKRKTPKKGILGAPEKKTTPRKPKLGSKRDRWVKG